MLQRVCINVVGVSVRCVCDFINVQEVVVVVVVVDGGLRPSVSSTWVQPARPSVSPLPYTVFLRNSALIDALKPPPPPD